MGLKELTTTPFGNEFAHKTSFTEPLVCATIHEEYGFVLYLLISKGYMRDDKKDCSMDSPVLFALCE